MEPDRERFVAAAVAALQARIAHQKSIEEYDSEDCNDLLGRLKFDYPLLSAVEGHHLLKTRLNAATSTDGNSGLQDIRGRHLETARQLLQKAEGVSDEDEGWQGCLCAVLHLAALQRALSLLLNKKWQRLDAELCFKWVDSTREESPTEGVDESENEIARGIKTSKGDDVYAEESDDDSFEFLPLDHMADALPQHEDPRLNPSGSESEDFRSQTCAHRFHALVKEIELLAQLLDNLKATQKVALERTGLRYGGIKKIGLNIAIFLKQLPSHEIGSSEAKKAGTQHLEFTVAVSDKVALVRNVAAILIATSGVGALGYLTEQASNRSPHSLPRPQELVDSIFAVEIIRGIHCQIQNAEDELKDEPSKDQTATENVSAILGHIDVQKRRWWVYLDSTLPLFVHYWEVLVETFKGCKTSAALFEFSLINWLSTVEDYIDQHLSLSSNEASNKLLQSGVVKVTSASMIELYYRNLDFGEGHDSVLDKLSLICLRLASSSTQVASYLSRVPKFCACVVDNLEVATHPDESIGNAANPLQVVWALVLNKERLQIHRSGSANKQEDPARALSLFRSILQGGKEAYHRAHDFLKIARFDKDQQLKWLQISAQLRNCLELLTYIRLAVKSGGGILKTRLWVLGSEEDKLLTSIYLDIKSPKARRQFQSDNEDGGNTESADKYWSEKIHEYRRDALSHLLDILKGTKLLRESKGD